MTSPPSNELEVLWPCQVMDTYGNIYIDLQAAVNAAAPGDTLPVTGTTTVGKNLTITGTSGATLNADGLKPSGSASTWDARAGSRTGSSTVHLYVREGTGHALIAARQWIPREHLEDPVTALVAGLPLDLEFRTKGSWPSTSSPPPTPTGRLRLLSAGMRSTGNCTGLRTFFEARGQAYVLRVPSDFMITLAGTTVTCAEAVKRLLKHARRWEVRSAGHGFKGERWHAWAWLASARPRHHLPIRRHLKTGDLAFHYCYVPAGQLLARTRLIRTAGLRWPAEEDFEFRQGLLRLGQSQGRLYDAIHRHVVLVMAALADLRRHRSPAPRLHRHPGPGPVRPDQPPPADPGMIPLTIPEIKRLLAALTTKPPAYLADQQHCLNPPLWSIAAQSLLCINPPSERSTQVETVQGRSAFVEPEIIVLAEDKSTAER